MSRSRVLIAALISSLAPNFAAADEGGVSFWLPGQFASLAATPAQPGWAFAGIYYHTSVDAGGGRAFASGGQIRAGLDARADLVFLNATYVSPNPVFGAQAAFGLTGAFGRMRASIEATLTGPGGGVLSGSRTDTLFGVADLFPMATLKWNRGVHNYMTYLTGNIPVGSYSPSRLANTGIGHAAIDSGVGYTYFDPTKGHEFSVVTGFTHNFENSDTNYQNGIDWHLDWAASQFLSKQTHVGIVGYLYNQLTGDSGAGATLGPIHSRVAGIGPQIGYIFPAGHMQGYLNLKGYYEFAAQHRPEGWNVWVTLAFSPPAPHDPAKPKTTK